MEIRILGRDLEVSEIGFGCMGMSHAYGTVSTQKEAEELIEKAIDEGCTFFDTAEIYGTTEDPHHNEKLLGEVLRPYRNKIVLASKCGIRFDETATTVNKPLIPDGRPETIKASIEGSLMRLNTDHLDLYYIHRIDMTVPIEETAGAMSLQGNSFALCLKKHEFLMACGQHTRNAMQNIIRKSLTQRMRHIG